MTQQINLYAREPEERKGPLVVSVLIVVAFAVLLGFYWHFLRIQTETLQKRVAQAKQQAATEKAAVDAMKAQLEARMDPKRVAAELASLKNRATEAQDIIDRLQRGELGSLEGFGPHFLALARIGEQGVWLTGVKITNAGKQVQVEGRSLEAESVLRYAGRVNEQVGGFGAKISSLELTPAAATDGAPGKAVNFKLF